MALSVSAGRSRLSWPKQEVNLVTAFVQAAIARFGFRRQTEALLTLFDAFALGETQRHAKSAGPSEVRVLGDVGLSLGLRRRGLLALCTLRW